MTFWQNIGDDHQKMIKKNGGLYYGTEYRPKREPLPLPSLHPHSENKKLTAKYRQQNKHMKDETLCQKTRSTIAEYSR